MFYSDLGEEVSVGVGCCDNSDTSHLLPNEAVRAPRQGHQASSCGVPERKTRSVNDVLIQRGGWEEPHRQE